MSIANLLKNAADAGVFLYVENQELRFKLTVSQFPENIKAEILQNKPEIIDFLSQLQADDSDNVEQDIEPLVRDGHPLPLSFEQQRFWFMDQLEGGSAHYNMPFPIQVKGAFDLAIAEQVLTAIVARHEILRTTYHWAGEKVVQQVNSASNFLLNRVSLTNLVNNSPEQKDAVRRIFKEDAEKCFNLGEDLMLRGTWIALSDTKGQEQGILLLNIHHIASDEQSQDVLKDELLRGYGMLSQGQAITWQPLAYQFADYAAWQRNNMTPTVLKNQIDYWKKQLNGIPELHSIPTDYPRPAVQSYRGSAVSQHIGANTVTRLKQQCLEHDVTPYIFIETVYGMLLSRYCNHAEVVVGSPYNARNRESMYPLLGCFLNNVLIRNQFDPKASFLSNFQATKQQIVSSLANTLVPYDMIVAELGHSRSLSYSPVNQLRFSFFDKTQSDKAHANTAVDAGLDTLPGAGLGIEFSAVSGETTTAKFDLILTATLTNNGIDISWIYNTDIFIQSTIEQLAESFEQMLNAALSSPDTPLHALPCLSATQSNTLEQWSQGLHEAQRQPHGQKEKAPPAHVVAQFEAQTALTPNAPALYFEEVELSFAELNRQANQLALMLQAVMPSRVSQPGSDEAHSSAFNASKNGVEQSDAQKSNALNTPPQYVGLLLPRSPDTVVAMLAALKAGMPYIPMDTAYPESRIQSMIDDADLSLVLTHERDIALLQRINAARVAASLNPVTIVALDDDAVKRDLSGTNESQTPIHGEDEAYVIYTSGSTGKPKGVVVQHKALANFVAGFTEQLAHLNLADNSPWLWNASYVFDASLKGLAALCQGRAVVLTNDMQSKDPVALAKLVQQHRLEVVNLPPLMMTHLLPKLDEQKLGTQTLDKQKRAEHKPHLMVSGDKIGPALWQSLSDYATHNHRAVINAYGPTEATVNATYSVLFGAQTASAENMGYPMLNTQTFVYSVWEEASVITSLNPVPMGAVGELFIAGESLAKGYLHQPEQSAKAFITHPQTGMRLYRTGDLVRYGAKGELQFIGRADHQVKIRGYRMELGDITQAVLSAGAEKAAVLAVGEHADKHLVAFVVLTVAKNNGDDALSLVTHAVQQQLPEYMQPTRYVVLDAMPLTQGGKVDTAALLPLLSEKTQADTSSQTDEATSVKASLGKIWADLLNLDEVADDDNFFVIGGHSILALNMIHDIEDQFGVEVEISDLYANLELTDLAECIEALMQEQAEETASSNTASTASHAFSLPAEPFVEHSAEALSTTIPTTAPSIDAYSDEVQIAPLSFSQQRLFFIDSLQGATPEYNMPVALKVKGDIDLHLIQQVFLRIIARHPVLRTVYRPSESGEQGVQIIQPMHEVDFKIAVEDVSQLASQGSEAACEQAVAAEVMKPFDLSQDVMFRVNFIKTGQDEGVLTFNAHHIASDGWSMQVITKEFLVLYQFAKANPTMWDSAPDWKRPVESPLAPLSMQYADYARWQQAHLVGDALDKQLHYWEQQLNDLPVLHSVPLSYPRPENKQFIGAVVSSRLSKETANAVQRTAQSYQLTPFMFLHGALSALLSRHSNSADIVIGTPVANRTKAALEPLVGFFVNTLALRVNTDFATLDAYFQHVKMVHMEAQANQDVPFEQLVDRLNPPRSKAHSPLFQIMMTMNADFGVNVGQSAQTNDTANAVSGIEVTPYHAELNQAKFDLHVGMNMTDAGIDLHWTYDVSLFSEADVQALNDHFMTLLTGLTQVTSGSIYDLPMLSDAEVNHLLNTMNDTERDYDRDRCIHELFEAQAAEKPDHTALVFESGHAATQRMSYGELNAKANQLARYLRTNFTITPDTKIGMNVNRSMEMVISILAVLKAGAAYVSLDPSYPKERIQAMVEDAQMAVVLTGSRWTHQTVSLQNAQNGQSTQNPQESVLDAFTGHQVNVSGIAFAATDSGALGLNDFSSANLTRAETGVSPNSLAYVIYTSGSTGKPKGVMIEHRSVNNLATVFSDIIGPSGNNIALALTSINFDISIIELYLSFKAGATLVLAKEQDAKDPAQIAHLVESNQVDIVQATPSTWKMLMDSGWRYAQAFDLFVGGEALTQSVLQGLFEHFPNARIFNVYGPTEATVWASCAQLTPENSEHIHLGKPIGNTQFYVLGEGMSLQPKGVPGELYIGGEGLGRGYVNPSITAERFVKNPFYHANAASDLSPSISPSLSPVIYRTGDLVCYNAQGNLEFVGRADDQVKIRGFRIELGEIEQQLMAVSGVDSAVVVAKGSAGAQKLVGYIKPSDNTEMSESHSQKTQAEWGQLAKNSLKAVLPEYMVPSFILCVEAWPMTINGKVNKRALPEPSDDLQLTYVAPNHALEQHIVQVWSDVLSLPLEQVSAAAGFFELGGNSLLVISLASKLRAQFGVNVPLTHLMESPTVQELALFIQAQSIQSLPNLNDPAQHQPMAENAPNCIVHLAQGKTQKAQENNLFCVHPLGGNAADYVELAAHLSDLSNVYGVQSAQVYGDAAVQASVTDRASLINVYVQAIKAVQKSGPYHLLGYSMGGNIAYDIACQLRSEGEEIGYLGLVDNKPRHSSDVKAKENWYDFLQDVITGFFPSLDYPWQGLGQYSPEEGIDILANDIEKFNLSFTVSNTLIRPYLAYFVGIGDIWDKMFPAQSDLDIYLASTQRDDSTSITLGWENFTNGNVDVTALSGTHGEIFQKPYSIGNISAIKAQLVSSGKLPQSQAVDGEVAV